jgi:glycerophosphoryl diester phosphodiesterase
MLEIDVGATRDGRLAVLHDNTVDRTTNGTGSISDMTLAQVQALDAAHWFVPGRGIVHDASATAYRYRGVRTGARKPPHGFTRADFRIPSLDEVLRAFPKVPMNIEIKGRDGADEAVYLRTAELLAGVLRRTGRRDIIVASFEQPAIDRFHALAPAVPVAPGITGTAAFVLQNQSPGPGVAAFQVPVTYTLGGTKLTIVTADFVRRAHEAGYAVHVWLSNDREDDRMYRRLLDLCVDGIMAAKPRELAAALRSARISGEDPCGSRVRLHALTADGDGLDVPLARRGRSQEHRGGTVTVHAVAERARAGRLLGTGRYELAGGAARTTPRVRLNAAGRAVLRGDGAVTVIVQVHERGRVVSSRAVRVR